MGFVSSVFSGGSGNNNNASYNAQTPDNLSANMTAAENATNAAIAGENGTVSQLQDAANGNGAAEKAVQQQLAANTAANNASANGLAAGARGINPGLAMRLAGENAATQNQTAAGQAATAQSTAEANALGQMATVQGNIAQQDLGQQTTYQNAMSNANNANVSISDTNANNNSKAVGGFFNGAGSAMTMIGGSSAAAMYDGGEVQPDMSGPDPVPAPPSDSGSSAASIAPLLLMLAAKGGLIPGKANIPGKNDIRNDTVPIIGTPGEIIVPLEAQSSTSKAHRFVDKIMNAHADIKDAHSDAATPSYGELMQTAKQLKAQQAKLESQITALKKRA